MPSRMIKESIRTSRNVNGLTDIQFRVWIHLITYVDDFGRGSADPELLRGLLFPRRHSVSEKQIKGTLDALASRGMIILYDSDGESYFYFPKFSEHQRLRKKYSLFPEPPSIDGQLTDNCQTTDSEMPLEVEVEVEDRSRSRSRSRREVEDVCVAPAHTRTREAGEVDDGFDAFWSAYPRKSGEIKGAYMEYVHALDTGATPEAIMAALNWQAAEWKREGEPRFIPSPEKWLKNRRWEEAPRESAGSDTSNIFLQIIEGGGPQP